MSSVSIAERASTDWRMPRSTYCLRAIRALGAWPAPGAVVAVGVAATVVAAASDGLRPVFAGLSGVPGPA